MDRCEQKIKIIEKIKKTENWDLLDNIEIQLEDQPQYITDYIVEVFEKQFGHLGHDGNIGDVYCRNEVMAAFEYDIRRTWIEISNKLESEDEYIENWCGLYVRTKTNSCSNKTYLEDLDFYINQCVRTAFHTYMIAEAIFEIWCKKVTFKEP